MRFGAPLFLVLVGTLANAKSLSIKLPDATYAGYHNATSGLDVWLGIRYAAPPVGALRWKSAQPMGKGKGVVNATAMPLQCVQSAATWNATTASEDCLYLNIYAPPRAKNLPVLVWIHGGSWDHNYAAQFDPTPLINLSGNEFVAVVIQYRLGVFGFLSGSDAIRQSGGFNSAITDARFALEFIQDNIGKFGGSKSDVTIWGQSAGGGTVLEVIVQEGRLQQAKKASSSLFKAAILSSPWFPPLGKCSDSYFKEQFKNFTTAAGCLSSNLTDSTSLACLRAAPSEILKRLNYQMNKPLRGRVNYWTACLEDESDSLGYLKIHPAQAFRSGVIAGDFVLAGSNAANGSAPTDLSTSALFENFLTANWPLTADQTAKVESLYPTTSFIDSHARGVSVYQDAVFACGSTWAAEAFTKRKGAWRYLFGILPAVHAQDNAYEFPYWYTYRSPVSPSVFSAFGGAMTNFTVRRDPNSVALNDTWLPVVKGSQVIFNMTSPANISSTGVTRLYNSLSGTKERCDFWAETRIAGGW
ncbi:alpha/beta-hydrolase [Ceratobasidium sp. AG-I]|nr:alpha/beta-hydrolase [Ceratobasidium sp. AG-I]